LEIGGGDMVWTSSALAPMQEEAVSQSAYHGQNPHGVVIAYPAAVIIVRDIQALMQTVLKAPGVAIEA
jgi:hypothetical protein